MTTAKNVLKPGDWIDSPEFKGDGPMRVTQYNEYSDWVGYVSPSTDVYDVVSIDSVTVVEDQNPDLTNYVPADAVFTISYTRESGTGGKAVGVVNVPKHIARLYTDWDDIKRVTVTRSKA